MTVMLKKKKKKGNKEGTKIENDASRESINDHPIAYVFRIVWIREVNRKLRCDYTDECFARKSLIAIEKKRGKNEGRKIEDDTSRESNDVYMSAVLYGHVNSRN